MTIASELISILGFKVENEQELKRYQKLQDGAEKDAIAHGKRMEGIGTKYGLAAAGVITTGAAIVTKAYKQYASVEERGMRILLNAGKRADALPEFLARSQRTAIQFGVANDVVIDGIENLIAKGQSVDDAWSNIASVLTIVKGTGTAVDDAADSVFKLRSAFGLTADEAARLPNVLAASGASGEFELKDMAQYAPSSGNLFAATTQWGGEKALKAYLGLSQAFREDTASAGEADTLMKNFMSKAFAGQTIKNFKKEFGIDLRAALKEEIDKGADWVEAYGNVLNRAVGGDTQRIQEIFPDQEANRAGISLISSLDRYRHFRDAVDAPENKNVAMENLNAMLDLQSTKLTKLSNQWENFFNALGAKVAPAVGAALDAMTNQINAPSEFEAGMRGRGYSGIDYYTKQFLMTPWEQKKVIEEGRAILAGKPLPTVAAGGDSMVRRDYTMPAKPTSSVVPAGRDFTDNRMSAIASMLSGMDARLAEMTGQAPIDANITDARTDARSFPVTVNSSVVQNIQQPSAAPGAVGAATNAAVAGAVQQQAARIQSEPAQ